MYKMSADEQEPTPVSEENSLNAVVKWFNNRAGYGFLTVCDGERKDTDVFVHHTALQVSEDQYKYLVEGEYVHFTLSDSTNTDHKHLATEVSGINGGKLMCETRNLHNEERNNAEDAEQSSSSRGGRRPRSNNRRSYDPQQWKLVRRSSQEESQLEV